MSSARADKNDLKEPLSEVPQRPEETQDQPGRKGPQEEATQILMDKVKSEGIAEGESASNLAIKTSQGTSETPEEPKISSERAEMEGSRPLGEALQSKIKVEQEDKLSSEAAQVGKDPSRSENIAEGETSNLASETSQGIIEEAAQKHVRVTESKNSAGREQTENHTEIGGPKKCEDQQETEGTADKKSAKELGVAPDSGSLHSEENTTSTTRPTVWQGHFGEKRLSGAQRRKLRIQQAIEAGERVIPRSERRKKRKLVDTGTVYGKSVKKSQSDTAAKTNTEKEAVTQEEHRNTAEQKQSTEISAEKLELLTPIERLALELAQKKHLSGAQRRKLRIQQAIATGQKVLTRAERRRKRRDFEDEILDDEDEGFGKSETEGGEEKGGAENEQSSKYVKVVVAPEGFPKVKMTQENAELLESVLMKRITHSPLAETVRFIETQYEGGAVTFTCANWVTQKWLVDIVPKLTPWDGAKLEVGPAGILEPGNRLVLWITKLMIKRENEQILDLLENQNKDLCTKEWKILQRSAVDRTERLVLWVDEKSFNTLQARGFRIFLGLGRVTFKRHPGDHRLTVPDEPQQHEYGFKGQSPPQRVGLRFGAPHPLKGREPRFRASNPPQLRELRFRAPDPAQLNKRRFVAPKRPQPHEFVGPVTSHPKGAVFMAASALHLDEPTFMARNRPQSRESRFMASNEFQQSRFMASNQLQPNEPRYTASYQRRHHEPSFFPQDRAPERRYVVSNQSQPPESRFMIANRSSEESRFTFSNRSQPGETMITVSELPQYCDSRFTVSGPQPFNEARFVDSDQPQFLEARFVDSDQPHFHESRFTGREPVQSHENRSKIPDPPSLFERRVTEPVQSHDTRSKIPDPPSLFERRVTEPVQSHDNRSKIPDPPSLFERRVTVPTLLQPHETRFTGSDSRLAREPRSVSSSPFQSRSRFMESSQTSFSRYSRL